MRRIWRRLLALLVTAAPAACSGSGGATTEESTGTGGVDEPTTAGTGEGDADTGSNVPPAPVPVRFAAYNVYLSQFGRPGGLAESLGFDNSQARDIAEVVQRTRPDVLVLNEFDLDGSGEALRIFTADYLGVGQGGQAPIDYPYRYEPDCNTGRLSTADLDNDGDIELPDDAYGYGEYDGQYCMVVVSRYPILGEEVRTWQRFLWRDMPGNLLPTDYYSPDAQAVFRLSSKTHADVPIDIEGRTVHFLISHPTPRGFDGSEDRNGRRNSDEIRLWADFIDSRDYLIDDSGEPGGLLDGTLFVIAGDLNADPSRGDGAIDQLLDHPKINGTMLPLNGDGEPHTADFGSRADYVLPSRTLDLDGTGMFFPATGDPLGSLAARASDHRLVWADVRVP